MIDDRYYRLYISVDKLIKGLANVLFVKSRAGTGKSYNIKEVLENNCCEYVRITGDISEGYFYRFLFEHNDTIIWINDSVKLLKNQATLNIIKSVTEIDGPRIITKHTYNPQEVDMPQEFECNSRFIFDFNSDIPKRLIQDFNALKSRGEYVELAFSNQDILDIGRNIFKTENHTLVMDYIQELLDNEEFIDVDLRSIVKGANSKIYCDSYGGDWKQQIQDDIKINNETKNMLYELMGNKLIAKTRLKELLVMKKIVNSEKTALRRIRSWIESEILFESGNAIRKRFVSLIKNKEPEVSKYINNEDK